MSGHSKWSQIKHKKGATDAKKAKLFSKLSVQISLAAKKGGDPGMNPGLRLIIDKAKDAGMTRDVIERAIKRGTGELGGEALEEVRYEAYGPAGIAILIDTVTDNKNRTVNDIRAVLNKFGGKLAEQGSVAYLFEPQGVVMVKTDLAKKDDIDLAAIDAGAADIVEDGEITVYYTSPSDIEKVKQAIATAGGIVESADLSMEPKQTLVADDSATKLLEALDELDDVTQIYTNLA